jgi:hypothetical protein
MKHALTAAGFVLFASINLCDAQTRMVETCRYLQNTGNILCTTNPPTPYRELRVLDAYDTAHARHQPKWLTQGSREIWAQPIPINPACTLLPELCPVF